jgi:hypothetical protein
MQVVSVRRQQGVGKKSGRQYDFQTVGGLIDTVQGKEYAEVMIDGEAPVPLLGKSYDLEIAFYPDREKRLTMRVEGLRELAPAKAA